MIVSPQERITVGAVVVGRPAGVHAVWQAHTRPATTEMYTEQSLIP